MGTVRALAPQPSAAQLADAVATFLDTIAVPNTRRGYAAALQRMITDLGADTEIASLDPDRVADWFNSTWGDRTAKTFTRG